jgi:zona occludens toxin
MDIARKVRAVVEETYYMEKLTAIGSTKRYRVDIHQGGKISRRPLRSIQRSYDPKYFGLYKSHSQAEEGSAGPREENIDQRGNILRGALFRFVLPLGVLVMLGAVWLVWRFLHPVPVQARPGDAAKSDSGQVAVVSLAKPALPEVSNEWRVIGYYDTGSSLSLVLSDGLRVRVLLNPPNVRFNGFGVESFLPNGEAVATWSGAKRAGFIEQAAAVK